jgi:hypothetical protein
LTDGSYTNIGGLSTTSARGFGATFNVTISNDGEDVSVVINVRGQFYKTGDTVTLSGATFGGTPGNNATINVVSVSVPPAAVGSGAAQAMTSNSTVSQSPIDGFAFCNPPSQVYIGAWSRPGAGTGVATLTVTSPANLASGADTIPFSQISWVMSGNGDTVFQFPNGSFTGGTQTLATFPANTWKEQCMTFSYANSVVPAAGTYTGRAVYTLSLP